MAAIFVASLLIQLALCGLPDTMGDLLDYRLWTRALARDGLAAAYWPSQSPVISAERLDTPVDYPPVFPYLLLLVGRACAGCSNALLDSLIRVPLVLANLAIGLLIFADARQGSDPGHAGLAAALYLFNPAIVFDTSYWGQADSLCALFLTASVVSLTRKPEWAWTWLALAVLTKPLAYPFVPLLMVVTLKRFGWARSVRAAGAFALCVSIALVPFLWIGRLEPILRSLFIQLDTMPYVSVNAHNLWWLVQLGTPWIDAREKAMGLVSYERLGIALFALFYVYTLRHVWRSNDERSLRLGFASVALGFFMLSTHMHENHAFNFLPLLLLVGTASPRVRLFFALVSSTFLVNMLLHDPYLTHLFRPFVPGRQLVLPEIPNLDPGFFDYFLAQGYRHLVDSVRGHTSLLGVVFTLLNGQANTLIFCAWLLLAYAGRSFDGALAETSPPALPRSVAPAAIVFIVATGVPFMSHALRSSEEYAWLVAAEPQAPSRFPGRPYR